MAKENLEDLKKQLRAEIEEELRKELEDKKDGVTNAIYSETELAKFEKSTKALLDKEPKVPIFIPIDPINDDAVATVGINGVIYAIPKGKEFLVPKPVKEIWEESYNKTMIANRKIKVQDVENREISITD